MKIAVVTPYYKEGPETLWRCHDSVQRQTVECTHILVADGHPAGAVAGWAAEHVILPVAHDDNGNTPRGLGAISALNRGYDAVAFLDADNWFAPDHLERAVETARSTGADVVFSDRNVVLSTGQVCPVDDVDIRERRLADTSSFFISASAPFPMLAWAMMDPSLSPICDRVMFALVHKLGLKTAWTGQPTLFYESRWASHFEALGLTAPEDQHSTDWEAMAAGYDPAIHLQRLGVDPFDGASPFEGHRFFLVA